jgi:8-oxo-dGTP pyrophosphatase MutT (NUDIX family)
MVRQWRHGAGAESLEFPGGIIEAGETPEAGALRELREETGLIAGRLTLMATMNPNPAMMMNHQHFFLAEDLQAAGSQRLDADEFVRVSRVPVDEVVRDMGTAPYIHGLMAAALFHYMRSRGYAPRKPNEDRR